MRIALCALTLVGCWTGAVPEEPIRIAPPVCLPRALADAAVVTFARGAACFGDGDGAGDEASRACFAIAPSGQATRRVSWAEVTAPVAVVPPPAYTIELGSGGFVVCHGRNSCRTFASPYPVGDVVQPLAVSADGRRAVVLEATPTPAAAIETDGPSQLHVDVYDVVSARRTARVRLNQLVPGYGFGDQTLSHSVRFAGDRLLIGEWPAGPSGDELLVDPVTGRALYLRGYVGSELVVDAHTLLVVDAKTLSIVDLDTVSVRARLTIPGRLLDNDVDNPVEIAKVGSRYLVALARPAAIAEVDIAGRTLASLSPIPICR